MAIQEAWDIMACIAIKPSLKHSNLSHGSFEQIILIRLTTSSAIAFISGGSSDQDTQEQYQNHHPYSKNLEFDGD